MPAFSLKLEHNMKKNLKLLLGALLLLFISFSISGCKSKSKEKPEKFTAFEKEMTNTDSMEVIRLVDQFFNYAENGQIGEAAGMLYENNDEADGEEPQPIDNKAMEKMKVLLNSLPIRSHNIDYIKFSEAENNEVKCTAIIEPAHDNVPEIKTVFYFKPIKYFDSWKLCIVDTNSGDRTIINGAKKDSMTHEFNKEMREKKLKQ